MLDEEEVIVVSGLPRSGTSMLMKMLAVGGCPTLTDEFRKPDKDNPNGYFECQSIVRLAQENSIVYEAKGKAIKVVSPLLQYLPDGLQYRVIFLRRDLKEIIASQQKMLTRNAKSSADAGALERSFTMHLASIEQWLAARDDFKTKFLWYADVIDQPENAADEIVDFLDRDLSIGEMVASVDKNLYRNRGASDRSRIRTFDRG